MNTVMLAGNLASEGVDVRALGGEGKFVGNFLLAVDRGFKKDSGRDFYRVTVWNAAAVNAEKYLRKGDAVIVSGHLRTSSYERPCEQCAKPYPVRVVEIHADEIKYGARARRNTDKPPSTGRGK